MSSDAPFSNKQLAVFSYVKKFDPIITSADGSVRSGKTYALLWLFINFLHMMAYGKDIKSKDFIFLGRNIASVERNLIQPLRDVFGFDVKTNSKNQFQLFDNRINCFGGDDSDAFKAMVGFTGFGGYINEATLVHQNSIKEFFTRCSGEGARVFMDTNPDHPLHKIKTDYIDKSGFRLDGGKVWLKNFHFVLEDNHKLTREYIESVKLSVGEGVFYQRKINGLWVAAEGAVYPNFSLETHTCAPFEIPEHWKKFRAIDLGYANPFVCGWFAVDPADDTIYLYDLYYQQGRLIEDHANEIKKRPGVFDFTVRDHDAQDGAELYKYEVYTFPAKKDVRAGIQAVGSRLRIRKNGKPGFMIFSNLQKAKEEMLGYVWAPSKDGAPVKEEPLKVNDHCPDMIRYGIMEYDFGGVQVY